MFGIERWLVFGGSWGSTLALAYGQAHPERCLGFVLRGIFLCTPAEIDLFLYGVQWFYPELYDEFVAPIPPEERGDLLQGLHAAACCATIPQQYWPAARAWSRFEGRRVFLLPQEEETVVRHARPGRGPARIALHGAAAASSKTTSCCATWAASPTCRP